MIQEVTMYSVKCDNCGKEYYDYHSGYTAMNVGIAIDEMAQNADWYSDGTTHYCTDCYEMDDNDELVVKNINL